MYDPNAMWQANRRPTGPVYRPQVQRPQQPTYRPQNGLGMLGQLPNEGPPMQQAPGYLPQEPGAYQQPGYNTGPLPPGFNKGPTPFGFGDGRFPGMQPPQAPPNKGGTMGFNDGRPGFQRAPFDPTTRPWYERLQGRGWR